MSTSGSVLCHSSTLIHSGLSTNERKVIRTSCPVYSGPLFYGREKFRFAEVNQKLLLGLEICAIASTPLCVRAGITSSASPQSWCAEPTGRSTQRWAARLTATKTRSSWCRGRPSRSRPCCPERLFVPLRLWNMYSTDIQMAYANHDWWGWWEIRDVGFWSFVLKENQLL